MSKHALITGVTGQDGAYLAKLLLEKANNDLLCKIIEDEHFNFVTTFYYGIEQNTKPILAEKLIV
jgi:GDP-D-mannose dehydratase